MKEPLKELFPYAHSADGVQQDEFASGFTTIVSDSL